jgi:hypothetical protein
VARVVAGWALARVMRFAVWIGVALILAALLWGYVIGSHL